jgi:hypothetical protein
MPIEIVGFIYKLPATKTKEFKMKLVGYLSVGMVALGAFLYFGGFVEGDVNARVTSKGRETINAGIEKARDGVNAGLDSLAEKAQANTETTQGQQ